GNLIFTDAANRRLRKIDTAGIISTVAGNGLYKFAGDGGPATAANLNNPYSGSLDANGNLYIADLNPALIRKVTPSGIISTIAGNHNFGFSGANGSPAVNAVLSGASTYSAFDASGNFYFSDSGNHRVRKIDLAGNISTVAGTGLNSFTGDNVPATGAAINNPR